MEHWAESTGGMNKTRDGLLHSSVFVSNVGIFTFPMCYWTDTVVLDLSLGKVVGGFTDVTCPVCIERYIVRHLEDIKSTSPRSPAVDITFLGFCSKKNRKAPNKNGRGLHIEKNTKIILDRMEMQVPGNYRDLMLDNPEAEWFVTYTNAKVDVDGIITTVLDILQKYRVIINDNIAHFGNRQVIHPAVRGKQDSIRVVLTPR